MAAADEFDLGDFLPYLLDRAAEASSRGFVPRYRDRYGMLRTEWRVLFHLGRHGPMTATAVARRADIHKTKVSRAVAALEAKRFLVRAPHPDDRRHEVLSLTGTGASAFRDLLDAARAYDAALGARFTDAERTVLRRCLRLLAAGRAAGDAGAGPAR